MSGSGAGADPAAVSRGHRRLVGGLVSPLAAVACGAGRRPLVGQGPYMIQIQPSLTPEARMKKLGSILALLLQATLLALGLLAPLSASAAGDEAPGMLPGWLEEVLPIVILLAVVGVVIGRLPKVKGLDHAPHFIRRRVMNWLPLGLTYAFLYMGRYNLQVAKSAFEEIGSKGGSALMGNDDFGIIFGAGTVVYGFSFLLNGPLTDRLGGKFSMLMGSGGAAVANLLMGLGAWSLLNDGPGKEFLLEHFLVVYSVLYSLNMYFQSFGAVAIVKVNAPWFHVRERGVFGAIFGILISLGIYFAFDWGYLILGRLGLTWVFLIPAALLAIFLVVCHLLVRNTPGEAGLDDFDTADASSGQKAEASDEEVWEGVQKMVAQMGLQPLTVEGRVKTLLIVGTRVYWVFVSMLTNPVVLTIAGVEFCSGFLRQAIMQWYRTYAKQTDAILNLKNDFVSDNWGLLLCCAGILGGTVAGVISDHVFQSRRGPVAFLLYAVLLVGSVVLVFTYQAPYVGWLVILMSVAVIGVHGMLSGTASMDFGGKRNVGIAVGIIDGFVYLGTGVMSFTYAIVLPKEQLDEAGKLVGPAMDPDNWIGWPVAMVPIALLGTLLTTRIWNAKPKKGGGGH